MMNNPFSAMSGMFNNPIMQLVKMAQGGGDPLQMIQQLAGQNPQANQALKMLQGKSPQQIQQMAMNMSRERGTTPEEIARSLGLK